MELKNCIKFCYCGVTRFIICDLNSRYEDIIKILCEAFEVPKEKESAIYLTNGKGYIFGKPLFEYFILLFPQPEITFYIRLDYSSDSINSTPALTTDVRAFAEDDRIPLGFSKLNNNSKRSRSHQRQEETEDGGSMPYAPSPVRRQNCFLGYLPRNTEPSVDYLERNPIVKRICRMHKERKPLATIGTSNQISKRNLRL